MKIHINVPTSGSDGSATGGGSVAVDGFLTGAYLVFSAAQAATTTVTISQDFGGDKVTLLATTGNTDVMKWIVASSVRAGDTVGADVTPYVDGRLYVDVTNADDTESVDVYLLIAN